MLHFQVWFQASSHCGSQGGHKLKESFQNQRQKAKLLRGNMEGGSPTRARDSDFRGMPQYCTGPSRRLTQCHQSYMALPYPRSMGLSQLSGPGIPGPSDAASLSWHPSLFDTQMPARVPSGYTDPVLQPARTSTLLPTGGWTLETSPVGPRYSRRVSRPGDSSQHFDYSLTLPQIVEAPLAASPGPSMGNADAPLAPICTLAPVPSLTTMAKHQRRHTSLQTGSPIVHAPSMNIPPPFTLQPQPQWENIALSPYSRPGSSSLSHPGSSHYLPPASANALLSWIKTLS